MSSNVLCYLNCSLDLLDNFQILLSFNKVLSLKDLQTVSSIMIIDNTNFPNLANAAFPIGPMYLNSTYVFSVYPDDYYYQLMIAMFIALMVVIFLCGGLLCTVVF
jgi:hypothetical protein